MFQNIARDFDEEEQNQNEDVEYQSGKKSFVEVVKRTSQFFDRLSKTVQLAWPHLHR